MHVVTISLLFLGLMLAVRAALGARFALDPRDRVVVATASLPITIAVCTQALGRSGVLEGGTLAATLTFVLAALVGLARERDLATVIARLGLLPAKARRALRAPLTAVAAITAICALAAAFASATLLDTWAWDSLGYHLPIAHDVVQTRTLREVPGHLAYIETYPRFADLVTAGLRVLLGREDLVELSQWPFLPLLVAVCIRTGRRLGARAHDALAFALAVLTLPVVFLQCATSYVDVAYAALVLGGVSYLADRESTAHDALAALFFGLALATKPTAPVATAFALGAAAFVRHGRGERGAHLRVAAIGAVAVALGAKVYVDNLLRFGNPVWPIALRVGPWTLPGHVTQDHILALGLSSEQQSWSWLRKVVSGWLLEPAPYVFDMRFGGFGPVFGYLALPVAIAAAVRSPRARALLVVGAAATLSQAGAFTGRYTIALAALALVVAGATIASVSSRTQRGLRTAFGAAIVIGAARASGGFTDGGPSLRELATMPPRERARTVGKDMHGEDWFDLRAELRPGEAFAYDASFGLPSLAFRNDGTSRLVYLGADAPDDRALDVILARERVRFVALRTARASRSTLPLVRRFACGFDDCVVLEARQGRAPVLNAAR
jgi:hypothetical protein